MNFLTTGALGSASLFGLSGAEIYRNFHGGTGDDGRGLSVAADSVRELLDHYDSRVGSITALTTRMESSWEGDAAGAARRGAGPLAVEHARAKADMAVAEEAMVNQVSVFDAAKRSVREVPPTPDKPGIWENLTSLGGANRSYEAQMNQVSAANDVNVAVMERYEGVTQENADRMPSTYGSIAPDHSSVGVRPSLVWPPEPGDPIRQSGGHDDGSGTGTGSGTSTNPQQSRPPQEFGTRPQGGGGTSNNPGVTNPNQFDPPRAVEPPRSFPPPGPGPGPGGQHPNLPPGMVPGYGPGQGAGNGPGGRGPAGRGPAGGGFGPRGGGFGPGGAGAGGAGAASGQGGGPRGAGGGFGPGAAAAEGAAPRGGFGAGGFGGGRGGAGVGGVGGMGGGRGQGGGDNEHERPTFLVEPDPHETFGTDEVTAPPVIGE